MGIAPYPAGIQEKTDVALSSLLAAVGLTGAKLAVGVWTNSLGILSEALHSGLADIVTHIEPCVDDGPAGPAHPVGAKAIREVIDAFLREHEPAASVRDLKVRSSSGKLAVSVRCLMAGSANIREAHAFTERLEGHLRAAVPLLHHVVVHAEPLPPRD